MIRIAALVLVFAATALVRTTHAANLNDRAGFTSADALVAEAIRYERGEGVARNVARAADLYCGAVRLGNPDAAYRLGWMYVDERGIQRNDGYALALFRQAAKQGHDYAARMARLVRSEAVRLPPCITAPESSPTATSVAEPAVIASPADMAVGSKAELDRIEQFEQAERVRGDFARSKPATAEQLAQVRVVIEGEPGQTERAADESATPELARSQQLAQAERTRAEQLIQSERAAI